MRKSIKMTATIAVGITTSICCANFLGDALRNIGIPVYIDYDECVIITNRSYDEEVCGSSTAPRLAIMALSAMIGFRIGVSIYNVAMNGGMSKSERIGLNAWLLGFLSFGLLSTLMYYVLADTLKEWGALDGLLIFC